MARRHLGPAPVAARRPNDRLAACPYPPCDPRHATILPVGWLVRRGSAARLHQVAGVGPQIRGGRRGSRFRGVSGEGR